MKRFYIMKLNKFTVVLAILLVSILTMGAVSAETVDDSDIVAVADGDIQESVDITDTVDDLSTANNADETVGDDSGGPDDTTSYDLDDDTYLIYKLEKECHVTTSIPANEHTKKYYEAEMKRIDDAVLN